jgi:hypothetical protein
VPVVRRLRKFYYAKQTPKTKREMLKNMRVNLEVEYSTKKLIFVFGNDPKLKLINC